MSDAATAAAPEHGAAASHVSTPEWQSFEMRMRRRRAQRCLLRAEVALEAGFPDDAREALDEAGRLNAPPDEIARIEQLIATWNPPRIVEAHRRPSWRHIAAASVVIAATALAAGPLLRDSAPSDAAPPAGVEQAAVTGSASVLEHVPAAKPAGLVMGPSGTDAPAAVQVERFDTLALVQKSREADTPSPVPVSAPPEPPSTRPAARFAPLPPVNGLPLPTAPEPAAAASAAVDANVRPNLDPVPELSAPPPMRDESADVRAVLSKYESAYSRLDPSGARAIWPGVDERALSRAFSSLASQRVSLGRCDITLNGVTARATCAGSATWSPKVGGGGARTEARRWTFDLRKSGDAWHIQRAVMR